MQSLGSSEDADDCLVGRFACATHFAAIGAGANVRWDIPAAQGNADSYLYLSLRIGQLDGGVPTGARVWIRNDGYYSWVDLPDYGGIPEPIGTMGHMHTVQIPLGAFGAHDDVEAVYLQFHNATGVDKRFIVDNLEFAQSFFVLPAL